MFSSVVLVLCFVVVNIEAARILAVFPTPSISHQVVFRPITQELARRGHDITVVTPDPVHPKDSNVENFTEIDVHDISYAIWDKFKSHSGKGEKNSLLEQAEIFFDVLTEVFEKQMQDPRVKKILNQTEDAYDLLLIEACVRPALSLTHKFKAPTIVVSSMGAIDTYEALGVPTHFYLYPNQFRQRLFNLTMWEKITELLTLIRLSNVHDNHELVENAAVKRIFGPEVPPVTELSKNIDMALINTHPIFEGNVPVPQSVVHIWGIHEKQEKELPKDLQNYLDRSKNGVIYMSFGTNTDPTLLPPKKIQMFNNVFSQLPYDVLWKWNKDKMLGKSKNIKIGKWFPQSDLLRHPNVKVFITQGGIQSTGEAITAHVPMVGVPMLGDQWYNVEKGVHLGIGVKLDWETITEEKIRNAILTIIENDSYRDNIAKLDILMRENPQTPLDRAIWWTEHVLRHNGAKHFRSPAAGISWAEYLELDLLLVLFSIVFIVVSLFLVTLYYVVKSLSLFVHSSIKLKTH